MKIREYTELTWEELGGTGWSQTILLLPVGSIEQHGPHLPLDTDTITALHLGQKLIHACKEYDLLLAPPLRYTYAKPSTVFPGTISINGETLIRLTRDVLCSFIDQGFVKILVLNSHMENTDFLIEGISLALEKKKGPKIILANWWEIVSERELKAIFGKDWKGWVDEHAALVETSLMMSIAPRLVRRHKMVDDSRRNRFEFRTFPWNIQNYPASGVFSTTSGASREKGEALIKLVLKGLNELISSQF
jgi:creatinine amidohydrolase